MFYNIISEPIKNFNDLYEIRQMLLNRRLSSYFLFSTDYIVLTEEEDTKICSLIRDDLIDDFIVYVNSTNIDINKLINTENQSANLFLQNRKVVTLIQYAIYYGAIQIFNYLKLNGAIVSDAWKFAVYSNSAEMIHLLEQNDIKLSKYDVDYCIEASIRAHCSKIAIYLINNYSDKNVEDYYMFSFQYYNFDFFLEEDFDLSVIFLFLFEYDHFDLISPLIKEKDFNPLKRVKRGKHHVTPLKIAYNAGKLDIFNELCKLIQIQPNATTIEHDAFLDCVYLKEITIPPSVVTIEDRAFFGCSLVYVKIPSSVTSIGAKAFGRCNFLEEVVFEEPSSLAEIGNYAFYNCSSLKRIKIPKQAKVSPNAFKGCNLD
ncbi:hypothetical protein M9Y10_029929 [Tritrichomonas musculus]|uniref:Surface antigen BspA-like n=1 Tax=Tritrichomonas musculus TaxID=1915356 RepID=A0ABR2KNE5_9EUKA